MSLMKDLKLLPTVIYEVFKDNKKLMFFVLFELLKLGFQIYWLWDFVKTGNLVSGLWVIILK